MKILFITHYAKMYGANKSLCALILDMKLRYNITPVVFLADHSEGEEEEAFFALFKENDIEVQKIKFFSWQRQKEKSHVEDYVQHGLNHLLILRILFLTKKYHFDLIYSNSSVLHLGMLLSKLLHVPHIWHIREFGDSDYNLRYTYSRRYIKTLYESSDKVIAISNAIMDRIKFLAPNARCVVIENGIKSFKLERKLKNDNVNFCCVGVLSPNKNQLELLKAGSILLKNGVDNFKISLIGNGNPSYVEELKKYAELSGLKDRVDFLGYRPDVHALLEKMDVGIVTSLNEAFGRVTVEYMLAEMPVIGANTGGTKEIIENEITGFLYDIGNEDDLANKMKILIQNREMATRFGECGRKVALDKYVMEKNTDRIFELINELVDR